MLLAQELASQLQRLAVDGFGLSLFALVPEDQAELVERISDFLVFVSQQLAPHGQGLALEGLSLR